MITPTWIMFTIFSCTTMSFIAVWTPSVPPAMPTVTGRPANRCAAYSWSCCSNSRENAALSVLLSARITPLPIGVIDERTQPVGPGGRAVEEEILADRPLGSSGMA